MSDSETSDPRHAGGAASDVQGVHAYMQEGRPTLGTKDAAKACGVHTDTIRRAHKAGKFPNADNSGPRGALAIPVGDLLAAGFTLHAPSKPDYKAETPEPTRQTVATTTDDTQVELARLKAELAAKSEQIAKLEADKAALFDLMNKQLLALNAGNAPQVAKGGLFSRLRRA